MPYETRDSITIPPETKAEVREAKEHLGISYREFLERAAEEMTEN